MQPVRPNAFALKNSGLDTFLHAEIGTEMNGSALTILSMVARLGRDPWEEAAKWAALPKAAVIDGLAQSIAQMPLAPSALAEARIVAAKLVLLLPAQAQSTRQGRAEPTGHSAASRQMLVLLAFCTLAIGMALSVVLMPKPPAPVATPAERAAGAKAPGHRAQAAGGEDVDAPFKPTEASTARVLGKAEVSSGIAPALR